MIISWEFSSWIIHIILPKHTYRFFRINLSLHAVIRLKVSNIYAPASYSERVMLEMRSKIKFLSSIAAACLTSRGYIVSVLCIICESALKNSVWFYLYWSRTYSALCRAGPLIAIKHSAMFCANSIFYF